MSVTLTLEGHDPEPHASDLSEDRAAWGAAVEWMRSLPPGKFPAVDEFVKGESYAGTDALSRQLDAAALEHDPGDAGGVVESFLDRLGGGHPGESVAVTTY